MTTTDELRAAATRLRQQPSSAVSAPLADALDYAADVEYHALQNGWGQVSWVPRMLAVARAIGEPTSETTSVTGHASARGRQKRRAHLRVARHG